MKSLVTGAKGFIGSHLADSLANPILCDKKEGIDVWPPDEIDIIFNGFDLDAVYHLGAISSTTETNTEKIVENNLALSCQLLEKCIASDIPFLYASSASVYGMGKHGFSEDAIMDPLNYYAISKCSFDSFVLQKIKDNPNSKIVGLRYFNVYGSGEDHKGNQASPVHKFINQARHQRVIKVFEESEKYFRDFVHVDDVVKITLAAKEVSKIDPGIYNVGTGVARSFMEVADVIAELTNSKVETIPFPKKLKGKYQSYTCSDNEKTMLRFPCASRISLESGIKMVLND